MTEELGFSLENIIAGEMGFSPMSREVHKATWPKPLPEIITTRIPGINVEEFMTRIGLRMSELATKGEFDILSTETFNTLKFLNENNFTLSILTSRTAKEVEHLVNGNHLISKLIPSSNFYYKEKTIFGKPDPRVFNTVLSDLKAVPREAMYVGDSPTDSIAAKLANMFFIGTTECKLKNEEDFPKGFVDKFITKISDLKDINTIKELKYSIPSNTDISEIIKNHNISVPHYYFNEKK
jgi:phosphoglycolate phosphatase-like HAD superfamily hydrolase